MPNERTDTERLDGLERLAIYPIEIDDFRAPDPCFLTIETGEQPLRFQAVGLRAVLDKALDAANARALNAPEIVKLGTIRGSRAERLARDIREAMGRTDDPAETVRAVEVAITPVAREAIWRQAFLDYGQHHLDCPAHPATDGDVCTCGFIARRTDVEGLPDGG